MWTFRLRIRQLVWKLTALAIWCQCSDAMRRDYHRTPKGLAFHTWLGFRVFGDERGYLREDDIKSSRDEMRRLNIRCQQLEAELVAILETSIVRAEQAGIVNPPEIVRWEQLTGSDWPKED